ncbi:MAG TPA: efflux RND transporter permease subunit [Candidatus Omnitrophota bacterium]|nr:efflux RND transporter permease subunit [Candidatus Omnitrophota bacterium]
MILSDISIKRPVFAWMMMFALILFGALAFWRMGISLMPDVDFPIISINLNYSGASPQIMETDVVDFVEDAVMGVQGVKSVTSTARDGSATVTVEFDLNRDIDVALQEVQTKISQAQRLLPPDLDPPVITKTNPEDQPIIWLSLKSDGSVPPRDLMAYVHDNLKDSFSTVSGVGNILLGGYTDPSLRVWIRKKDLAAYNLTAQDVVSTVQNEHVELPGGYVQDDKMDHTVRTMGEAKSAAEFEQLRINARGGQPNYAPVPIIRVARIEDNLADIEHLSRANGDFAVGLGIVKQRGTNAVDVAHAVTARLAEVKKDLPAGMDLSVRVDNTKYIEDAVNELKFTLLLSAILTGLVCWLFLGSWTSAFNVWLAIPTSIVGSFLLIYFFGFTLNTFTMIALSLAIGIVVDDAIMVLENIVRHQEAGQERVAAALIGAREITFAATAASIAIIAIFLPVAFMTGIIGKYFFQFGVTITIAVLLSLFEALTLTPMRASQFVSVARHSRFTRAVDNGFKALREWYRSSLSWALDHRWQVVAGSLVFFLLTFSVGRMLRTEFVPPQDQSLYLVRLQTPAWASLNFTDQKARLVEAELLKRPEVSGCFTTIGGFSGGGVFNSGQIFVTMKPRGMRGIDPRMHHELSQSESMLAVRGALKKIPDLKAFIQDLSLRGFSTGAGFPIEFTVRGPEWDKLGEYTQKLTDELDRTGLMTDLGTNYQLGMTEYDIVPDREKAAEHGVSFGVIAQNLSILVGGYKAGTFERNGHRYDINVKMQDGEHQKADIVRDVYVRNNRGELVPLNQVTKLVENPALQTIYRSDRERATTIFGNLAPGRSQAEVISAVDRVSKQVLPGDYHIVFSGSSQAYNESFSSLVFALILGIIVAYMVLGSQFNSFIDPLVVLLALPFSFSGAFLAMYLTGMSLNIFSMIGFILLMGLVKKNSILLVDFTNQKREQGLGIRDALLEACPIRLRPILMTSAATIAGAIPAAINFGPGAETRTPMAIAVIGGLLVSTLLTLYIVPCVYSLMGYRHETVAPLENISAEAR